ncbi:ABC transporter permease [Candidatus Latescibacterota bacterium]
MTLLRLITREIFHNKMSFGLGLLSVIVAVGVLVGELTLLDAHDIQTQRIVEEKEKKTEKDMALMEDDYRKIMKELGFNLLILPKGQRLDNFYSDGYAAKFMPEENVTKLSNSKMMTIRHLLPSLEQKIKWPEQENRTIILIGVRGEVPFAHRDPKEPMQQAVPGGTIVLGYEISASLGLAPGDNVRILGADFKVGECHTQRGNKDDITVWIDLAKSQELLDRRGEINAILALKCLCAGNELESIRKEIAAILPGTQVIELENKVSTREKARMRAAAASDSVLAAERSYRNKLRREKEVFASWLIPLFILGSTALIGFITFNNVRERRHELGILRAIGLRSSQILFVFLVKASAMGLIGSVAGYIIGFAGGLISGGIPVVSAESSGMFDPAVLVIVILTAPLLTSFASWVPALIAARQDPAVVLREE